MGRNSTPKLDEWRGGERLSIGPRNGKNLSTSSGDQIVYSVEKYDGTEDIRAVCYADGAAECLAAFWQSGFHKGVKAGIEQARAEMRATLGCPPKAGDDTPALKKGGA